MKTRKESTASLAPADSDTGAGARRSIEAAIRKIRAQTANPEPGEDTLYCGKCSYGWIVENGRARRCPCLARRGVGSRQDAIDALLRRHRAGISQKLSRVTAHTFLVRPGHEHIKPALDKYIKDLEAGQKHGWFIFGPPGVGKSFAAAYVVNTVKHKRILTSAMINFSRTLTALRATFGDEAEHRSLLSVLFDTPLLAIDDLGMEQRVNENPELSWAVSKFYEVIDYRRDEELPTIITSNRTPEQLTDRLGEAIMARIKNLTLRLDIENPSGVKSAGWSE